MLAVDKKSREHVTLYIWKNKKNLNSSLKVNKNIASPYLKFDIDTLEDLKEIRKLVDKYRININTKAQEIINYK